MLGGYSLYFIYFLLEGKEREDCGFFLALRLIMHGGGDFVVPVLQTYRQDIEIHGVESELKPVRIDVIS